MDRVSLGDRDLIARQLGRAPRGDFSVAQRCVHGFPQVLRVSPILEGRPFPTLYWISCPFLRRAIGALEAEGWVKRFEEQVAADEALREELARAHDDYVASRVAGLAPEEEREAEGLAGKGIGGIADRTHLKCLHLHVAHALVGRNPIGDEVLSMLGRTACEAERTICSSLLRGRSRSEINR